MSDLIHRIKNAKEYVKIAIIGSGYVGLPLGVEFSEQGFDVTNVDNNEEVIKSLKDKKSTVEEISDNKLSKVLQKDNPIMFLYISREKQGEK